VDGLRQGYGVWIHDGKRYQGEWRNNMIEGQGTMEWGISGDRSGFSKTLLLEKEVGGSVLRRIGSNQEFKDQGD